MTRPHTVGIVGATGYTGLVLIETLLRHSQTKITYLAAHRHAGEAVSTVYPQLTEAALSDAIDIPDTFSSFDPTKIPPLDTLFLATPHGQSHQWLKTLIDADHIGKIIDLSADFRLKDPKKFKQYYNIEHQSPELLSTVPKGLPLGLPEIYREQIREARVVACPGCYSTSAILALYPLAKAGLLSASSSQIIIDSKSGASGAGRSLSESNLFCEVNESVTAYSTGTHRHTAEIEQELGTSVIFSPHLVPMMRGILSSCYLKVPKDTDMLALYKSSYKDEPFITVHDTLERPSTKYVVGSNQVRLSFKNVSPNTWVIFSALDNLVKGASGQAIQVMNIMNQWEETTGLTQIGRYL